MYFELNFQGQRVGKVIYLILKPTRNERTNEYIL